MADIIIGFQRQMESILLPSSDQFRLAHDALRERIFLEIFKTNEELKPTDQDAKA